MKVIEFPNQSHTLGFILPQSNYIFLFLFHLKPSRGTQAFPEIQTPRPGWCVMVRERVQGRRGHGILSVLKLSSELRGRLTSRSVHPQRANSCSKYTAKENKVIFRKRTVSYGFFLMGCVHTNIYHLGAKLVIESSIFLSSSPKFQFLNTLIWRDKSKISEIKKDTF